MDHVLVEMLVGLGYLWLPSPSEIVPLDCDVLPHVEQELVSLPEHLSSHPVLVGFCVMFYRSLFALFLLTIILSVFL